LVGQCQCCARHTRIIVNIADLIAALTAAQARQPLGPHQRTVRGLPAQARQRWAGAAQAGGRYELMQLDFERLLWREQATARSPSRYLLCCIRFG
jgi:hypothetical protein